MAKQRAVSSSPARAGTRTVTVLRSLPLPPGPVPAAPGNTSPGPLSSTVRPGRRRSRTARRRSRPRGRARRSPDRSPRRWASADGRPRLALPAAAPGARRHIAVSSELAQQRCGPVQMIAPLRCRSRSGTQQTADLPSDARRVGHPTPRDARRCQTDDVQQPHRASAGQRGAGNEIEGPLRGRECRRVRAAMGNCVPCTRRH